MDCCVAIRKNRKNCRVDLEEFSPGVNEEENQDTEKGRGDISEES